jgi:hypothetical protein
MAEAQAAEETRSTHEETNSDPVEQQMAGMLENAAC